MIVASVFAAALLLAPAQDAQVAASPTPNAALGHRADVTFDGRARFRQAVREIQATALNANRPGFEGAVAALEPVAADASDAVDMLPIYRDLLQALGDRHSFVQAPSNLLKAWAERSGEPLYLPSTQARWTSRLTGRPISSRLTRLASGLAVQIVVIPALEGGGRRGNANAQAIYDVVAPDRDQACGAVLDLRGNTGGNAWSMLLGLHPLIGGGEFGRSIDATGVSAAYARSENGAMTVLEGEYAGQAMSQLETWREWTRYDRPIAVLIDDATASSGEQVALELRGRAGIRLFGQTSYGIASSNRGVMIADDVNLVVTSAWMQDGQGLTWPDGVVPDEAIAGDAVAVLDAAVTWLGAQRTCMAAADAETPA